MLFLFTTCIHAQTKVLFKYDDAGNQEKREICFGNCVEDEGRPGKQDKPIAEIEEEDYIVNSDNISFYPNPVREELYVKWQLIDDKTVQRFDIYSMGGQLLYSVTTSNKENTHSFPFSNYAEGQYLLVMHLSNGEQETLKIIKK